MPRNTVILILAVLAFNLALAHGPFIEIIGQRIVTTDEGRFLEVEIHAPEGEEQVSLTAGVTAAGTGVLEERQGDRYEQVFRVPILQDHDGTHLGADTPYRIRLPEGRGAAQDPTVTLMFGGGTILHIDVPEEVAATGRPIWRWFAVAFGVTAVLVLSVFILSRSKGNQRDRVQA